MTDDAQDAARKPTYPPGPPEVPAGERPTPECPTSERPGGWPRKLIGSLLPLIVLAGGVAGAIYYYYTGPKPKQRPAGRNVPLVRATRVAPSQRRVVVRAMGTVVPARQIVLQPRVNGEIVRISDDLIPGGLLDADRFVLEIDPTDYDLAVKRLSGEVARAELAWRLELGQQAIAQTEYELLSENKPIDGPDKDLILRKPHLAMAKSVLAAARASKAQADLDLARTTIAAPFNATVLAKHVDVGAQVTTATKLATLVGTDEYWLQVAIPVSRLKWLTIPRAGNGKGSAARIFDDTGWGPGVHRVGHVTRLLGDIEPEGRMARVLVTVPDPLALKPGKTDRPAMLLGALLRVEIDAAELDGVFEIPRRALRNGSQVWILDKKDKLEIREVDVAWRDRERVLVRSGLAAGERLITSDLATPIEGMDLTAGRAKSRPAGEAAPKPSSAGRTSTRPQTTRAVRP